MNDDHDQGALGNWPKFGSMPWKTMIDGTSVRERAAAHGADQAALPSARLHPRARTGAVPSFSVMKLPAYGVPMPVVAVAAARRSRRRRPIE